MKRRDLIKNSLLAGSSAVIASALSGCSSNVDNLQDSSLDIKPKQTATYNICAPLPFNYKLIDDIKKLNNEIKKSEVVTLYNNIPYPLWGEMFGNEFQGLKRENTEINNFDDFAKYVLYAQSLGFNFVYILNSPKPFDDRTFKKHQKKLYDLLDKLEQIGCKEIKVANQQLVNIISNEKPDFKISLSTSFEYHNVSQYYNLINTYPNIKSINIATDDNKNFVFLRNLKKLFPKIDIEIMVNEDCIHGCPARISHASVQCKIWKCNEVRKKMGAIEYFCNTNMIYPWDLEYYSSIGINTFKFMSPCGTRANIKSLDFIAYYLKCIESGIGDLKVSDFFNKVLVLQSKEMIKSLKNDVKLSEIVPYLPDIKHFIKHGQKCANICHSECNYCLDCAKKIRKIIS